MTKVFPVRYFTGQEEIDECKDLDKNNHEVKIYILENVFEWIY